MKFRAAHTIHPKEFQPLRQGYLDGLCGLYSLLNAARLAVPTLSLEACRCLFREGAHWLYDKGDFPKVLYEGMSVNKIMGLHKAVIQRRVPGLRLKRPFTRSPPADAAEFWTRLKAYAEQPGHGAIICVEGRRLSHWTVVCSITSARLMLFDSDGRAYLVRQKCSYAVGDEEATTVILPGNISLLENTHRR